LFDYYRYLKYKAIDRTADVNPWKGKNIDSVKYHSRNICVYQ